MSRRLRRLCQPSRMSQPARLRPAASASRALHTYATGATVQEGVKLAVATKALDLYEYTTERWLHNDELQREARRIQFDFAGLCAKAVKACAGATKVVSFEKKEGGFNRVFLLQLDNGTRAVARVPYGIAGARRLTTNSEVATMAYSMYSGIL